ncbi:MAG: Ig-like domain-containing protein [Clostridia bacterium]|nr:Ig-like domain-containing protein [Clostridia bacterium]
MRKLLILACVIFALAACGENTPTAVTRELVTLSAENAQMAIGETMTLTLENYFGADVSWKSSDDSIAAVDANGTVSALGLGSAAITAKTETDTLSCLVAVSAADSAITSISVHSIYSSEADVTLNAARDTTIKLNADTVPAQTGETLVWKSENPLVASVDQTGVVTARGNGRTNIVVTARNGVTGICIVRVRGASETASTPAAISQETTNTEQTQQIGDGTIPTAAAAATTQVMISDTTLFMEVADIHKMSAIAKDNISDVTISWVSSAPAVAVVDTNGKVVAVGSGLAVISAVSSDGAVAYCQVAVGGEAKKALEESQTRVE